MRLFSAHGRNRVVHALRSGGSKRLRMTWSLALAGCLLAGAACHKQSKPTPAENARFFDQQVRPVLCAHCIMCHNAQLSNGNLSLASRADVLKGGSLGPVVTPFRPEDSLMIHAVRRDDKAMLLMPPGPKLPDHDIATLNDWVSRGIPWGSQPLACSPPTAPPGPQD